MGVRLSKEYGLNPSVQKCTCCDKDMGLIFFGSAYHDEKSGPHKTAEAPREVMTGEICDDCKNVIANGGTFFIEVRDGESGINPYRTGRLVAIKTEVANEMFKGCKSINFMHQSVFSHCFNQALAKQALDKQASESSKQV